MPYIANNYQSGKSPTMKNILKLSLLALTATACSKYEPAGNDLSVTVKYVNYNDSITNISSKTVTEGDSSKIVFENNIYRSSMTIEG